MSYTDGQNKRRYVRQILRFLAEAQSQDEYLW